VFPGAIKTAGTPNFTATKKENREAAEYEQAPVGKPGELSRNSHQPRPRPATSVSTEDGDDGQQSRSRYCQTDCEKRR